MPYTPDNRVIHDADAHIIETPDWFDEFGPGFVSAPLRARVESFAGEEVVQSRALHADADYRANFEDLMGCGLDGLGTA